MTFPSKSKVPVAQKDRSNLDLSCQHVTTTDFMTFSVAKAIELVPNQSMDIQMQTFARLEPLPVPTFGRARIKNRCYFVPYRTIFAGWNDFINDEPHVFDDGSYDHIQYVPRVKASVMMYMFNNDTDFCKNVVNPTSDKAYDFKYVEYLNGAVSNTLYRKFTNLGRFAYKLLRSLGYNFTFSNYGGDEMLSLMPLYSAAKVYVDFFFPAQYANDADTAWIQSLFTDNKLRQPSESYITRQEMARLIKVLFRVCYDPDYFTSAWDMPNAPNADLSSNISMPDINNYGIGQNTSMEGVENGLIISNNTEYYDSTNSQQVPQISTQSGTLSRITQYALTALRSLSDYLKRNQIVGSRNIDRYLARWGVVLRSEKLNRSVYIGEMQQPLQFGDVTSTADTEGANLGQFAGRGLSFGDGSFRVSSGDEFGMLIIVSTVVPDTQYYEGRTRHTMHLSKLDFFTPEFDNLGTQALACSEVYSPVNGDELADSKDYYNRIFGFVPRYAEYKVPVSHITGDYILNSMNTGKDAWTLFRSVKPYIDNVGGLSNFIHSYKFVVGLDASQFNRIFYNTESNADHFNVIHDFNIKTSFPGKSLFDTYEFADADKSDKVTIDVGGDTHN